MIKIAIDFDDTFAYSSKEVTLVLYHIAKKFGLPFPHDDQPVELKGANRRDFYFDFNFNQHISLDQFVFEFLDVRQKLSLLPGYLDLFELNSYLHSSLVSLQKLNIELSCFILSYRDEKSLKLLASNLCSELVFDNIINVPSSISKSTYLKSLEIRPHIVIDDKLNNFLGFDHPCAHLHSTPAGLSLINPDVLQFREIQKAYPIIIKLTSGSTS